MGLVEGSLNEPECQWAPCEETDCKFFRVWEAIGVSEPRQNGFSLVVGGRMGCLACLHFTRTDLKRFKNG